MVNKLDTSTFDESLRQSLSALMDGESSELEVRRVLAESEKNTELRDTWSRYQLASRIMRGKASAGHSVDLSASISELIADEPQPAAADTAPAGKAGGNWLSNVGKVAVAASVAVLTVFATNQFLTNPAESTGAVVADVGTEQQAPAANLPMGYGTSGLSARTVSTDGAVTGNQRGATSVIFVPRSEAQAADASVEQYLEGLITEHADAAAGTDSATPFERVPRNDDAE